MVCREDFISERKGLEVELEEGILVLEVVAVAQEIEDSEFFVCVPKRILFVTNDNGCVGHV